MIFPALLSTWPARSTTVYVCPRRGQIYRATTSPRGDVRWGWGARNGSRDDGVPWHGDVLRDLEVQQEVAKKTEPKLTIKTGRAREGGWIWMIPPNRQSTVTEIF